MKRSRFSEDQIIGILKAHEVGVSVADLCRKHDGEIRAKPHFLCVRSAHPNIVRPP